MKQYVLALVVAATSGLSVAGTASSQFFVKVELRRSEKCVSETLSALTNAVVQVVCRSGIFVSIEPQPGRPLLGAHGGAYRYFYNVRAGTSADPVAEGDAAAELFVGYGTVTGFRVVDASSRKDREYEFLITY